MPSTTINQSNEARNRITRSIINLIETDPFFSAIILNLNVVETTNVPTCAVSLKTLMYNPNFVMTVNQEGLNTILVHEACHIVFRHPLVFKAFEKDRDKLSAIMIAAELAVNSLLVDRKGFESVPDGVLVPGRLPYQDMPLGKNTTWYYDKLYKELEKIKQDIKNQKQLCVAIPPDSYDDFTGPTLDGSGDLPLEATGPTPPDYDKSDSGVEQNDDTEELDCSNRPDMSAVNNAIKDSESKEVNSLNKLGTVLPDEADNDEEQQKLEQEYDRIVSEAVSTLQKYGGTQKTGYMEEMLNQILKPTKINWEDTLKQYFTKIIRAGRSYKRPNRRYTHMEVIMPSRLSKGLRNIYIGIDTSGSMDQEQMSHALSVILELAKLAGSFEVVIDQFDTEIKSSTVFNKSDIPSHFKDWNWQGRGGTSYNDVIDKIKRNVYDLSIIVTDGYPCGGTWPPASNQNIIWLITDQNNQMIPDKVLKYNKVIYV